MNVYQYNCLLNESCSIARIATYIRKIGHIFVTQRVAVKDLSVKMSSNAMVYHMTRLGTFVHFVRIVITDIRDRITCKGMSLGTFTYI